MDEDTEPKLSILLVEDNADSAVSFAMLLRYYGHKVGIAKDGPSALRMAEERTPDVVLLDLGLPGGMDGYELARQLQERAKERSPLLIAVTGYGGEENCRRSAQAGILLHLLKPIDTEALNELLEKFKAIIKNSPKYWRFESTKSVQ